MRYVSDPGPETFLRNTMDWLARDPVHHNVISTVTQARLDAPADEDRWLRVLADDSTLDGVAMQTPPHPMVLSVMSTAVAAGLAEHLRHADLSGVNGPAEASDAFAGRRADLTGEVPVPGLNTRMYRLDEVTPPI